MKYDTVLFDADGTLLDFHRSETEAIKQAMKIHNVPDTDENVALYSRINDSLWKKLERGEIEKKVLLYRRFELLFDALKMKGDAMAMCEDYISALSTKAYLLDGAEDMCKKLYGKVRLYIVTNGVERVQKGRYARSGLDRYFEKVFISGELGAEKPSVAFFEKVASNITGFDRSRTVIVGDSLTSDMAGGLNFEIDTCWYAPQEKKCPDNMNLTYIAKSFDDVIKYIMSEESV